MFVVSTLKDWVPGRPCSHRADTIEKAEEWITKDANEYVGKFLQKYYVYRVDITKQLVYTPEISISVTTPAEEDDATL